MGLNILARSLRAPKIQPHMTGPRGNELNAKTRLSKMVCAVSNLANRISLVEKSQIHLTNVWQ